MKKLYSLFTAALVAFSSLSASADDFSFTINFDDPAAVTVTKDYSTPVEIVAGVNSFTAPMYTTYTIKVNSGYAFESVTNASGTSQNVYDGTWYLSLYDSSINGQAYVVKTINLDAARDSEFTMTVDNPQLVRVQYGGTGQFLDVKEGTATYKFAKDVETSVFVQSLGSKNVYKITVDDVNIPVTSYSTEVPLTPGCVVDVQANYPDMPCVITLDYDAEATPGLVYSAAVNYSTVSDFDGKTLTVQAGDVVTFYTATEYKVDAITIGDVPQDLSYYYNYFTVTPAGDVTVKLEAHPYGKLTAYVTVNDPELMTLYAGYQQPENIVELVAGRNEVKVPENTPAISWAIKNGCEFVSISSPTLGDLTTASSVNVTEGLELNFEVKAIQLDKTFVFFTDYDSTAPDAPYLYYFRLSNSRRDQFPVVGGYNVVDFTDSYNPYELGWAGATFGGAVYVNGELLAPMYEDGTYWNYTAKDNDVVKAYVVAAPVECDVKFVVEGEGSATLVRDLIQEVADWQNGFTCFADTKIVIAPEQDFLLEVKVNGEKVDNNEAGAAEFVVTDPATEVEVKVSNSDGVGNIAVDNDVDDAVYNLQGVKVGTKSTISTLPAGLYINGGSKVVVK